MCARNRFCTVDLAILEVALVVVPGENIREKIVIEVIESVEDFLLELLLLRLGLRRGVFLLGEVGGDVVGNKCEGHLLRENLAVAVILVADADQGRIKDIVLFRVHVVEGRQRPELHNYGLLTPAHLVLVGRVQQTEVADEENYLGERSKKLIVSKFGGISLFFLITSLLKITSCSRSLTSSLVSLLWLQ